MAQLQDSKRASGVIDLQVCGLLVPVDGYPFSFVIEVPPPSRASWHILATMPPDSSKPSPACRPPREAAILPLTVAARMNAKGVP